LVAAEISRRLDGVSAVLTHAYEGGHPDHDACALACQVAVKRGREETPFYHAAHGALVAGEFATRGPAEHVHVLEPEERVRKELMFAAFASQAHVFERFPIDREVWRAAPVYDFLSPPHPGTLYYETRDLGFTYAEWRALAEQFLS
jgi:LmbE family N-acetylglucosaminyl deacetylase